MSEVIDYAFLCKSAIKGCFVRELYIRGEEAAAHEECAGGEAEARLLIKLSNDVERSIRGGATFAGAIMHAEKLGLTLELRNFEGGK